MVHDALWGLMVHDKISKDYKNIIDDVYLKIAEEDGENSVILKITGFVFKMFGGFFSSKTKCTTPLERTFFLAF